MRTLLLSSLILILFSFSSFAQTRLLTIEEATGQNPKLSTPSLSQLQWQPGTERFVYVAKNCLVQGSPAKTVCDTLIRLHELNVIMGFNHFDTLKRFPAITFTEADRFWFMNGPKLFFCDIMKNSIEKVTAWDDKAENTDVEKSGKAVAYTLENNLFISHEGSTVAVSDEKNKGIVYGSSRVHRNEFGISKGTFWSPDGNSLAFYRMDETMVTDYPLVDITPRIATVNPTKYPMAGMTSHTVTVGILTVKTGKTVYLQTASPAGTDSALRTEYLTNVTWSPDNKYILIATLNRDQNFMQLIKYDAGTGRPVKILLEEKNLTYVEPSQGPEFLPGDPEKFLWESRRDGYNHLYLYDTEGTLLKQVTAGPWEVAEYLLAEKNGPKVWFSGNRDNPLERHLFCGNLETGEITKITTAPGTHYSKVAVNGRFVLDTYSSTSVARQSELLDAKGQVKQVLLENSNPLRDIQLGETTLFSLKNAENTDLYCRLIKPAGFDPAKKYPVIIYVYGGPHSQLVTNTWLGGGGLFLNYLADLGYVVFTLDNRGTSGRGREFEQAVFRNLGVKEMADQMVGVNYLKSLPYVDSTRIGLNGWSYGGFMTVSLFLKHPGVFKVAVCGGPVIDWKYYEVMYGERYMDTPQSNPEGYRNACLTNYVKNLKGKLLIIHDDQDGTVVPQNSLTFLKTCVDEGKPVDFFLYPGHEHNVRGKDRVHLNQKMVQYFLDYL